MAAANTTSEDYRELLCASDAAIAATIPRARSTHTTVPPPDRIGSCQPQTSRPFDCLAVCIRTSSHEWLNTLPISLGPRPLPASRYSKPALIGQKEPVEWWSSAGVRRGGAVHYGEVRGSRAAAHETCVCSGDPPEEGETTMHSTFQVATLQSKY